MKKPLKGHFDGPLNDSSYSDAAVINTSSKLKLPAKYFTDLPNLKTPLRILWKTFMSEIST